MAQRIMRLCVLILIVASVAKPSINLQAQGASTIWYDFETGIEDWTNQSGAIPKIEQSGQTNVEEPAKSGQASLKLTVDFTLAAQGNIQVSLKTPMDLTGKTISAWVYTPPGIRGDPKQANGLHLFVEDTSGKKVYATWQNFLEGGWFQITLRIPQTEVPACGLMSRGFKSSAVKKLGLNIARAEKSTAVFRGVVYLDKIEIGSTPVANAQNSTYFYDFEGSAAAILQPAWQVLPGWEAGALTDPTVTNNVLSASAHFVVVAPPKQQTDETQKGVLGIIYSPALDLSHKTHTIISADIRFEPTAIRVDNRGQSNCPFVMAIMAYDDKKQKWFRSDDINVGTGEWTHISFDIADMVQYKPGTQDNSADTISLDSIRQVAFQFWANASYDGKVILDNIAIGGQELPRSSLNSRIVQAKNAQFDLNGQAFRFVGANAEYLSIESSSTIANVLDQAASTGIKVIRVWGFGEGCENTEVDNCEIWSRRFQPAPGQWNEAAFRHFDLVVAMAAERGIRLVVPFANNWDDYGGKRQYVEWLNKIAPDIVLQKPSDEARKDLFYTDEHIRQWYKNYVAYFLSRTNSITGIQYTDDPTIFAWELINEPRAQSDPTGATLHNWIVEMSEFIDSIDPNHMIGTGEEGWYIMSKADADKRATLPDKTTVWQSLPANYWEYGVSVTSQMQTNGVDFISDHSSQDTQVCWQAGTNAAQYPKCETRKGVPKIDFASIHVYIDPEATNILRGPYCDMKLSNALCKNYDSSQSQALLWINQHTEDANKLGKPLLLAEFGFHKWDAFGAYSSSGLPGTLPPGGVPNDWVPVTGQINASSIQPQPPPGSDGTNLQNLKRLYLQPFERARLFQWYLERLTQSTTLGGVMFWNLGFDGYMEGSWENANVLSVDTNRPLAWQYDPQSDATTINNCRMTDPVEHGRYAICVTYDPSKGTKGAFVTKKKESMSASDADWTKTPQVRFDVYSTTSAFVMVRLVAGADQVHYESVPIPVMRGWNTVTVDISKPVWRSTAGQNNYNQVVELEKRINIRQVSIGLVGYTTPGSFYLNRVRFIYDDSFVVYPGDPALEVIKEAIYLFWR